MCVMSMVGDAYADRWKWVPVTYPPQPNSITPNIYSGRTVIGGEISRAEFDALKREVAEMKELLIAAKRIDELTEQPDCENEGKLEVLRRVAELVGVDLEDVLG